MLPLDTLLAVAEEARHAHGCTQVVAVLDARMNEVYHARCEWLPDASRWHADADFGLSAPEAVTVPDGWTLCGNAQAAYGDRLAPSAPHVTRVAALPTARALLRLAPAQLAAGQAVPASDALPRYIRDKVAQTTAERAALRASQSGTAAP